MGYHAFNKMTIQLPIPPATMTKAEYKEAYGIDLDDLDFAKVTLLVDGKEKYAVDGIKNVSDDILILAGGNILTIGDDGNVSVTADAYSVENAKPIYCHPVVGYINNVGSFTALIFNNSSDAIDTWSKLKSAIVSFDESGTRRLVATGGWVVSENVLLVVTAIETNTDATSFFVCGFDTAGVNHSTSSNSIDITSLNVSVIDKVNKIN